MLLVIVNSHNRTELPGGSQRGVRRTGGSQQGVRRTGGSQQGDHKTGGSQREVRRTQCVGKWPEVHVQDVQRREMRS